MTSAPISIRMLSILLPALLTGCVVGPDYRTPQLAVPTVWHSDTGGGLKTVPLESARLSRWWQTLDDPLLSRLVAEAAANNLDLKLAEARLREARVRRGLSASDQYPALKAGAGVDQNRSSGDMGVGGGRVSDAYSAQFDASWEPDLFGGKRRALEAASATSEAAEENLRDVQVSLLAEVVLNYIEVRSSQEQINITRATITSLTETVQLAEWRLQAGLVSQLDLEQARLNLEQTRAQLPALSSTMEQSRNSLALLLGRNPGTLEELQAVGPIPSAKAQIAIGLPAETLRQRPDIRRAERQLAAATAQVGQAEADRYPNLSLSGTIGLQASSLGNLLQPGAYLYTLAANTVVTIFDGGRLRQKVEIQNALQQQALISYQSAVKSALRDVENALAAYAGEQNRRQSLQDAVQAAKSAVELATSQYAAGLIDFQPVLDSQRSLLSLRNQLTQSQAAVTSNLARLYKAVGGGWSNSSVDSSTPSDNSSGEKS